MKPTKSPTTIGIINTVHNHLMTDSGASTNIVDDSAFRQISKHTTLAVTKPSTKLMAYGFKTPLSTV